jgi:hypothetical protein
MISPIVALLSEIIPSPAASIISPMLQPDAQSAGTPEQDHDANARTQRARPRVTEDQDRRQMLIGEWNCVGTKWSNETGELPYYGHLRNEWALDKAWLVIHFKENQVPQTQAFSEDQYWGISADPFKQTRVLMTNGTGLAILTASEWQTDTVMWTGTYTVGITTFELTEKMIILNQDQFRWIGEIILNGGVVGTYDVVCSRLGQSNDPDTPVA